MADSDDASRKSAELKLLIAGFPDELSYDETISELIYDSPNSGFLKLKLADDYPGSEKPAVVAAYAHANKAKLDAELRAFVDKLPGGEEVLDVVLEHFNALCEELALRESKEDAHVTTQDASPREEKQKITVIIWLHHLLNSSKRKQVLHPPSQSVSGVSKPGYPGVLVFSGPESDVLEHVNELKQLKWQAFQVRGNSDGEWLFRHGKGVVEVESMADLANEISDEHRAVFLEALKIK